MTLRTPQDHAFLKKRCVTRVIAIYVVLSLFLKPDRPALVQVFVLPYISETVKKTFFLKQEMVII